MSRLSPFGIHGNEKVSIFIDGAGLYVTASSLLFEVDYSKLLAQFEGMCQFKSAKYYTAVIQDSEYDAVRPLIDYTSYNGYCVTRKAPKEWTDAAGKRRSKGSIVGELTVGMLEAARHCDHIVLFSGDGDFVAAVEAVQRMGVRVTVVSTIATNPAVVSDDLRRAADRFVDLANVRAAIERAPRAGRPVITRAVA
ncbi:NYN domain-containing protein [Methylobacterium sp. SD274]|uniref:LabA-like NYN domain-containing protein n=1 Tax=Methylobacterium sp. SD274 TaxID=2782009 RepID=UPI001A95E633|nr:NYN domain-containing protein [Methylobacterium sp. SD274]MBO1022586.1 NYN domain-containing protein [Methylobacterium sp. SD274]